MYQNCCKKCGSISLHTEVKGNNTGLYCDDCGSWIKWLPKDELRAFEYSKECGKRAENSPIDETYDLNMRKRLEAFVEYLDKAIDKEYEKLPISPEDAIRKNSYCLALERDKNAILNILAGRDFDDLGDNL